MNNAKYSEEHLRQYLSSHAALDAFYITRLDSYGPGLINYFDPTGRAWRLMEDDDALVAGAIKLLTDIGAPLFDNIAKVQEFERSRQR